MLLSLRVEFLGLVFLIIYVGAIAILFLFVLMLFNLKDLTRSAQELTTLQWSLFLLITPALVKIYFLMVACFERFVYTGLQLVTPTLAGETVKTFSTDTFYDIFSISGLMYSRYTGPFVLISYILLTAMIGAIVLAMHTTPSRENRPNTTFSPLYGASALVLAYKDGVSTLALADPDGTFFFYFIENTDSYFESSGSTPLLAFTSLLYLVGLTGMIFNYKNFLVTMMSVELMYLGVVSSFVILGTSGVTDASATGMLILILVACESAIGLGILIVLYRFGGSVAFKDFEQLGTTLQSKKRSRRRI
jgi:NADH:ubiquinone oxidoreductase subunit 6 (subunit J)/NADH:ubiquinone oxidoreductase subunit K